MKKLTLTALVGLVMMTGCNNKQAENENQQLRGDLQETLATQDSLFALLNDITDNMQQIKELERIASTPGLAETPSRKQQIMDDMAAIRQALQDRRERLAQLEQRLNASQNENAQLKRTVASLRAQIEEQETEIQSLTNQLAQANIRIEELGTQVTTLTNTVDTLNTGLARESSARQQAEAAAQQANTQANICYYCIGSKSELKARNILQSGFLRKTKIMQGEFDQNFFTTADRRNLRSIALHSKKAKVLTGQPQNTYEIVSDENGMKTLNILDPARFWQMTNYLVVQID